jgi:starch-binding outer membrane protein, SusD/RagB family
MTRNRVERHGLARPTHLRPFATALAMLGFLALTGCNGLLDVNNPNNVNESDLNNPVAAGPEANGALAAVMNGTGFIMTPMATVGDEMQQLGSRDAWGQLDRGLVSDPTNEFSNAAWPQVAQGRWMADEAIKLLEGFDKAGTLPNRDDLARSYLYGAIIYTVIADSYNDTVVSSDHETAGTPVGSANMYTLYDTALKYATSGLAVATATGNNELQLELTAMKARIYFDDAVWHEIHPPGTTPSDPLVNDANAVAAAQAFFALSPDVDWKYRFLYSNSTVSNDMAANSNENQYIRIADSYIYTDASGQHVASIKLTDPIDDIPDPALSDAVFEFSGARSYAPLTILSAREMHLILAEAALAQRDMTTFTTQINDLRSLYKSLTPYSGQIPALQILEHERRVNLFMQGRRLADMYRFGVKSPHWEATSVAYTTPGTFFPIANIEQISNCHLAGTC